MVQLHRRSVVENEYVPAHCFFEAAAHSNELTAGMPPKMGAKLVRDIYAVGYKKEPVLQKMELWVQESHEAKDPAYDPNAGFVGTEWHGPWFEHRSVLMSTTNCAVPSVSPWVS